MLEGLEKHWFIMGIKYHDRKMVWITLSTVAIIVATNITWYSIFLAYSAGDAETESTNIQSIVTPNNVTAWVPKCYV